MVRVFIINFLLLFSFSIHGDSCDFKRNGKCCLKMPIYSLNKDHIRVLCRYEYHRCMNQDAQETMSEQEKKSKKRKCLNNQSLCENDIRSYWPTRCRRMASALICDLHYELICR